MARADIISFLRSQKSSPMEFNWNMLTAPNLYSLITQQDIYQIYKIATSLRYNGNVDKKYAAIDNILIRRGFKRLGRGTNRIVYKYLEDERFVLKVAMDKVALSDNLREMQNQFFLKPFVTKIFQVSPCGTVAIVERVTPITSREEFKAIAEDVFDLLVNCIIGKYVLDDIGVKYFMNYGIRCNSQGSFGPVLLDYPYVYPLDGRKLKCCSFNMHTGKICGGEIDYDEGFNRLVCNCCGKQYFARDLQNPEQNNMKLIRKGSGIDMKIVIKRGDEVISRTNTTEETSKVTRRRQKRIIPNNRPVVKVIMPNEEATVQEIVENNNLQQQESAEAVTREENIAKSNAIVEEAIAKFKAEENNQQVEDDKNIEQNKEMAQEGNGEELKEVKMHPKKHLTPEQMAIQMIEEQENQFKNRGDQKVDFKNPSLYSLQTGMMAAGPKEDPSNVKENKQINISTSDTFIPNDNNIARKNSFLSKM